MAASEAASSVLRVTSGGKVHGYVERALGALTSQAVRITASGAAVSKAVTVAEIAKRRRRGLHQRTQIGLAADAPTVEILLSSEPLDPNLPGYQAPLTDEELHNSWLFDEDDDAAPMEEDLVPAAAAAADAATDRSGGPQSGRRRRTRKRARTEQMGQGIVDLGT